MTPRISDQTAVTIDLKWLILIGTMLVSAGGVGWQMRAMTEEVKALKAQQAQTERTIIETVTTLRVKGVI